MRSVCHSRRLATLSAGLGIVVMILGCRTTAASMPLSTPYQGQYSRYLKDTLMSLEMMRAKTGLINDSAWVCWDQSLGKSNLKITEERTSPTNIGLDLILLVQSANDQGGDSEKSKATLEKLIKTLSVIPYHEATGLFYRTYWPDTGEPADIHLSSIDNLHLAFGLWTAGEVFRDTNPELAAAAKKVFGRMDLSDFYNIGTGLVGGNMRPIGENLISGVIGDRQGPYVRDAFDYKYFGSETRSLYALAWALGLYRKAGRTIEDFDNKLLGAGIANMTAETVMKPTSFGSLQLMRTWDGGGFQALLPGLLVREDLYSSILGRLHLNYAKRLLSDATSLGVPGSHSASAFGIRGLRMVRSGDSVFDDGMPIYNGTAGHTDLIASMHDDVRRPEKRRYWDIAYTPHPAFMAASFAKDPNLAASFASLFKLNETISSLSTCVCRQSAGSDGKPVPAPVCSCQSEADLPNGNGGEPNLCTVASAAEASGIIAKDRLYQPGFGWMDAYFIRGPLKKRVLPVIISLDQSMIALALYSILSPDGHHLGSKSILDNPIVREKLRRAYASFDEKLASERGIAESP